MSHNEMVSFPRELSDELAELIAEKARVCGGGAFDIWEAICEQFGTQAQLQGEPHSWTYKLGGEQRFYPADPRLSNFVAYADLMSDVEPLYRRPAEHPALGALKAFANDMINASFDGGNFEGGDIQDIAAKHGLLCIESRDEECGEICACREYGFPAECYRKTDLIAITPQ